MTATDLSALLAAVAEHAGKLRDRGVRALSIGDVSITLADPTPTESDAREREVDKHIDRDPLNDPATYGHDSDQGVPGFEIDEALRDEIRRSK